MPQIRVIQGFEISETLSTAIQIKIEIQALPKLTKTHVLFHFSQVIGVELNEATWVVATVAVAFEDKKGGTNEFLSRNTFRNLGICITDKIKTKTHSLQN